MTRLCASSRLGDEATLPLPSVDRRQGSFPYRCPYPDCGAISHHPIDAQEGFCGRCHRWSADLKPADRPR